MSSWEIAGLVLVAVLAGALLPAIVQLRATLRSVEVLAGATRGRLERTLDATALVVERLDRITTVLDDRQRLDALGRALDRLITSMDHLREIARGSAAIGAAIAPAITAAIQALRSEPAPAAASLDGDPASTGREEEKS